MIDNRIMVWCADHNILKDKSITEFQWQTMKKVRFLWVVRFAPIGSWALSENMSDNRHSFNVLSPIFHRIVTNDNSSKCINIVLMLAYMYTCMNAAILFFKIIICFWEIAFESNFETQLISQNWLDNDHVNMLVN